MKKALTITVAGTLFTIEEDAYEALDSYLKSIQAHFGTDKDGSEIIKDIEARIAEQLMERKQANGIVTIEAVNEMMAVMGTVEDFGDNPYGDQETPKSSYEARRRLYRNPDDVVIAGVCSGLAAYLGLDPFLVRVIFVVLVILGFGTGIILYLILALVLPEAITPAEKLQMNGGPVTLNSFKENIARMNDNVRKNGSGIRAFIERVFELFGRMVRLFVRSLRWIVGLAFLLGAVFFGVMGTFALINFIFNANTELIRFPVAEVLSMPVYYSFVALAYALFIIPTLYIGAAGLGLIRKKRLINFGWTAGLGAGWIVILIVFGSLAIRQAPLIHERILALPEYQVVTKSIDIGEFSKIDQRGRSDIRLVQGDEFSIVESGVEEDISRTSFEVRGDTLVITEDPVKRSCLFCFDHKDLQITITVPDIDSIMIEDPVDFSRHGGNPYRTSPI